MRVDILEQRAETSWIVWTHEENVPADATVVSSKWKNPDSEKDAVDQSQKLKRIEIEGRSLVKVKKVKWREIERREVMVTWECYALKWTRGKNERD